jgi:AraC-like DNA-binding protein
MARARKPVAAGSRMIPRVLRFLGSRGVDVEALVVRLRLPRDAERTEEVALTPDDFEALMAAAALALGDPLLAVHLPELLEWPSYSIGELAARASPTLRDAFERVVRYASLFYAHLSFACEDRGREFAVIHRVRSAGAGGGRYGNEYALASTLCYARRLSGVAIAPRRVFFAHAQPVELEGLRRHFGTDDMAFDRSESGLVFTTEDVASPSIGHDARLLATAEQLADRALKESPPSFDFVGAVAAKVRQSLAGGALDANVVARRMRLSTRTLQRRLEEHGTTFTALCESVRKDVARDAVRDPSISLSEVAYRVGFSDMATFSRAFKRWTGRSPGEFRKRHRQGD